MTMTQTGSEDLRRQTILLLEMITKKIRDGEPCGLIVGFADGTVVVGNAYATENTPVNLLVSAAGLADIGKASALAAAVMGMAQNQENVFLRPVE